MYAFSRWVGAPPTDEGLGPLMNALAGDPELARDFIDIWGRTKAPWEVIPRVPGLAAAAGETPEQALAGVDPAPAPAAATS